MSALLAVHDVLRSGEYHDVIVDTAPFGHTLRLFELPEHFLRFLDFLELAASRDRILAAHFGGSARLVGTELLAEWRSMVSDLKETFATDARLFLVTTPEKFSLNEALRCSAALRAQSPSLEIAALVLNRAVAAASNCRTCHKREQSTKAARTLLKREFAGRELFIGEDSGAPVVGPAGLKAFAEHVFSGKRVGWNSAAPRATEIRLRPVPWPVLHTPLSLVVGKGGVGKTTISAALGFRARSKGRFAVDICSADPAPSLDDVFQAEIGDQSQPVLGDAKFRASEMDSVSVFREWAAGVKNMIDSSTTSERSGIHVDLWFERQLFSQLLDSVPPGVDEILAVFRILELLSSPSKKVVIDMAPTGHALDLLRTPERILAWTRLLLKTLAAHRTLAVARDAGVEVARLGQRVRELSGILKSSKDTCIYTIMLAEHLPDRETERLIKDLSRLELPSKSLFVNRVLFAKDVGRCKRCQRARQWQLATLSRIGRRYRGLTVYVVRNFPAEIAGKNALRSFTGELWRLA